MTPGIIAATIGIWVLAIALYLSISRKPCRHIITHGDPKPDCPTCNGTGLMTIVARTEQGEDPGQISCHCTEII